MMSPGATGKSSAPGRRRLLSMMLWRSRTALLLRTTASLQAPLMLAIMRTSSTPTSRASSVHRLVTAVAAPVSWSKKRCNNSPGPSRKIIKEAVPSTASVI